MATLDLQAYEPAKTPEDVLRCLHTIYVERGADWLPDEPPVPYEHWRASVCADTPDHLNTVSYLARKGDTIVGWMEATIYEDHADSGWVDIAVSRSARGARVGTALLRLSLDSLAEHGRTKVIIDAAQNSPYDSTLRRYGLVPSLSERISRLVIDDLDRSLMQEWVDRASERAADYELVLFSDRIPDEYIECWCKIAEVMNTAPLEDLDLEDQAMTPEKWRSIENSGVQRGLRLRAVMAVHTPTGEAAGLTNILMRDHHPARAGQDDTAVHPDHRNRGLGRWLKAANALRVADEFPALERIFTGNAESNEAMLNINEAMGFRPAFTLTAWQGTIADVKAHLDRRPEADDSDR